MLYITLLCLLYPFGYYYLTPVLIAKDSYKLDRFPITFVDNIGLAVSSRSENNDYAYNKLTIISEIDGYTQIDKSNLLPPNANQFSYVIASYENNFWLNCFCGSNTELLSSSTNTRINLDIGNLQGGAALSDSVLFLCLDHSRIVKYNVINHEVIMSVLVLSCDDLAISLDKKYLYYSDNYNIIAHRTSDLSFYRLYHGVYNYYYGIRDTESSSPYSYFRIHGIEITPTNVWISYHNDHNDHNDARLISIKFSDNLSYAILLFTILLFTACFFVISAINSKNKLNLKIASGFIMLGSISILDQFLSCAYIIRSTFKTHSIYYSYTSNFLTIISIINLFFLNVYFYKKILVNGRNMRQLIQIPSCLLYENYSELSIILKIINKIILFPWVLLNFLIMSIWHLFGSFLYSINMWSITSIRNLWYFIWTGSNKYNEKSIINIKILNEYLYTCIIFDTIPEIVFKWFIFKHILRDLGTSTITYYPYHCGDSRCDLYKNEVYIFWVTQVISILHLLNGVYRIFYYKCYLGMNLNEIPASLSICDYVIYNIEEDCNNDTVDNNDLELNKDKYIDDDFNSKYNSISDGLELQEIDIHDSYLKLQSKQDSNEETLDYNVKTSYQKNSDFNLNEFSNSMSYQSIDSFNNSNKNNIESFNDLNYNIKLFLHRRFDDLNNEEKNDFEFIINNLSLNVECLQLEFMNIYNFIDSVKSYCNDCLNITRAFIPENIFVLSKEGLIAFGLHPLLAERIYNKVINLFIYLFNIFIKIILIII